MHRVVEPAILYFGTPVVLVTSLNEDGSANLAPISSAWWLGWRRMLGIGASSKTSANLLARGECVLNLPSVDQVAAVDRLARTTGSDPLPQYKVRMGYRHERDKFGVSELTALASDLVASPRVAECPVQLEAVVDDRQVVGDSKPETRGPLPAIEVRIVRVHIEEGLLMEGQADRIDPDRWRPLIMSFSQFYGLGPRVHPSRLAEIPESLYRPPSGMAAPARQAASR